MARIAVALSGGVDSSVAAALLQAEGHQVEGIFMKNWSLETGQSLVDCPWEQDQADAAAVCQQLGIPFRSVNFEREYYERVVTYFLREYKAGRTPNPDVMCNREIKFAAFRELALAGGADCIATGHYVRRGNESGSSTLLRGLDPNKDQSYFLYTLDREQLESSQFPLGEYRKPEVRELASRFGLPTAKKRDSQGICFIGHLDLQAFLHAHIPEPNQVVRVALLPMYQEGESLAARKKRANTVGEIRGTSYATVGERLGSAVDNGLVRSVRGGDVPPIYLLERGVDGTLYVTDAHTDPHFTVQKLTLSDWRSTGSDSPQLELFEDVKTSLSCQNRYQQRELARISEVRKRTDEGVEVELATPLFAVSPGQSLVVYAGERVVGGGVIDEVLHMGA